MSEVLKFAKTNPAASDDWGFIRTKTADDILRSLALVKSIDGPAMTMISGPPGVGKTVTLKHYERENCDDVFRVSVPSGEGNPFHITANILNLFYPHKRHNNDLDTRRRMIVGALGGGRTLLVDEAQNLYQRNKASCTKGSSFGWLVSAAEEGGFDLVFCGDLTLPMILLEFPHLLSRMRRPVMISAVPIEDVTALAEDYGVVAKPAIDLLGVVAKLSGGLRNVENTLRMAQIFAGSEQITSAFVKAAVQDLKLGQVGAK